MRELGTPHRPSLIRIMNGDRSHVAHQPEENGHLEVDTPGKQRAVGRRRV